jgi:hypothetical protein
MHNRFFAIACLLAIVALALHCVSSAWAKHARFERALLIGVPDSHHHPYTDDDPEIRALSVGPDAMKDGGLALTLLAFGFMVTAKLRRERGWYVILSMLLVADIIAPVVLSLGFAR